MNSTVFLAQDSWGDLVESRKWLPRRVPMLAVPHRRLDRRNTEQQVVSRNIHTPQGFGFMAFELCFATRNTPMNIS